jgi:hypothetical protein
MPPRLSSKDFDQELLTRFDAYMHDNLDRRGFLRQAQKFATAGVTAIGLLAALSPDFAAGQQVPIVRLRGKIESVSATRMSVRERGGELIELVMPANLVVNEVYAIELSDIKAGSFIGAGAMPQADGVQRAIAITVFPEAMRGTGEGHRPFDFMPQSTMTNATVADVVAAPDGRRLQVHYKDGEKTIVVPPGTPVVTFKPADRTLLVPGASVSISAQSINGEPTVLRLSVGRNGFTVPY